MAKDRKPNSSGPRGDRPASRKDELAARTQLWLSLIEKGERVGRHALTVFMVCFVAWAASRAVQEMAGKSTDFRSVIDWSARVNLSEYAAWAAATLFGVGYVKERGARRKMSEQAGPRLAALERAADPGRSSSGMMPDGSNPPGDNL